MKIFINIALLCITTIAYAQELKAIHQIEVNTNWEGRPRCNGGHGLCAITLSNLNSQTNTTISYYENGKVDFTIDRSKITIKEELKIVGVELSSATTENELIYAMKDDYFLNSEVTTNLKLSSEYIKIPEGNYPIKVTKDQLIISFNIE